MEIIECIDYLAQRGELTITCSEVAFASDELKLQINLPAWDRGSYTQALQECVYQASKASNFQGEPGATK